MFALARWGAPRGAVVSLATVLAAGLAGCAGTGERIANVITPYKVSVVQGNFVSREQVQALQPGMGRQQVREILGTPLMVSVFHGDRWEYVFTLKRPGLEAQMRKLTVFFKDGVMDHVEGDEMPSESEFVASLGSKLSKPKVPPLEATEEQLARFPKAEPAAEPAAAPTPPPVASYPPLEAPRR
ncbi:MAG: outer membrane protein assembly factor BamE [Comamonadaceae bacterium]|nr:outer membrane protein assembly factor BamE [Pseudomonadota bacterium]MDE2413495.1 outer membrane protein assembly factor BamE [Comamonadaceae bacterium]